MKAARKAFTETLLELAQKDSRIFAVATDSRGSVTLSEFAQELPQQFVECGIAEQDAIASARAWPVRACTPSSAAPRASIRFAPPSRSRWT